MAKLKINAGTTSKIVHLFIQNSTSNSGGGLTGLTYNTAGLTAYYLREGAAAPATAISLVTATVGTWVSGGFVAADATNLPGLYELHVPNAVLASGAQSVVIMLAGAANMVPILVEIELDQINYQDGAAAGLTDFASLLTNQAYLLGLTGHNQGIRSQTYDTSTPPNLLSCTICAYDTAVHAVTNDGSTGLLHSWTLANTYASGVLTAQTIKLIS